MEVMWSLQEALDLIHRIQEPANQAGWYVALAGGVLNKGYSYHDLDLVLVPMDCNQLGTWNMGYVMRDVKATYVRNSEDMLSSWRSRGSNDSKFVEHWDIGGRRIDLIYTFLRLES